MNAYEMVELLRQNIGEKVEAHWKDKLLLRRLNAEQREVARLVLDSPGDWLLTKGDSITPSSSLITLPSDCVRPVYLEEVSSGRNIPIRGTVRERRVGRQPGTTLSAGTIEAYFKGAYLEVNMDSYEEDVYLWYQPRIPDLHAGECGNGTGDTSIVFEAKNWPNGQDDYYNGVYVEVRDVKDHVLNVRQPITDYDGGTFTATIASSAVTPTVNDLYGTISLLPEELHQWIVIRATVRALAKPSSTFEKEIFNFWRAELRTAKEEAEEFLATRLSGSTYARVVEAY